MSTEFDDQLPDDSGPLPTDDDPEDEEEEAPEEQETPAAAKTTPAPPPQKLVKKPRGAGGARKPKPPVNGKPDTKRGPAPQLSNVGLAALNRKRGEAGHIPPGVGAAPAAQQVRSGRSSIDPAQEPTKELVIRWPLVLEKLADEGLDASAVALGIYCVAQGAYATPPAHVGVIDGRSITGGGELSPGDAARDYIEVNFHAVMQKPARYEARIYYKTAPSWQPRGGNMICNGWLELPAYDTLVQLRSRQAAWVARHPSSGHGVGAAMPTIPPPAGPMAPAPLSPHVLQTLQAMGYQITPIGGGVSVTSQPMVPQGPSFSEDITRELLGRMLRGEPIGAQPPAPVVIPAPAPAPAYEPPHVPTLEEQLEGFARLVKIVDQIRPPAPAVAAAPPVGVGRTREAAPAEPMSPFAGFKDAIRMIREATNLQEELAGLTGGGRAGNEEDDQPAANPVEKPFEILEVAGVGKWPYGDKLSPFEQIKTFAMLNPDITMGAVSKASELIDKSAIGEFFRFLIARGTAAQRAAAQGAIAQGMARAPSAPTPPAMPPVIRPPQITQPQQPQSNGAAAVESPPAPVEWRPMT